MASYEHDFLAQADNVPSMSRDPEEEKVVCCFLPPEQKTLTNIIRS